MGTREEMDSRYRKVGRWVIDGTANKAGEPRVEKKGQSAHSQLLRSQHRSITHQLLPP